MYIYPEAGDISTDMVAKDLNNTTLSNDAPSEYNNSDSNKSSLADLSSMTNKSLIMSSFIIPVSSANTCN